jgi:hypothetical protein
MDRFAGEPTLDEMLSDPLVRTVMRADGIDRRGLCEILVKAAQAIPPAPRDAGSPAGVQNT